MPTETKNWKSEMSTIQDLDEQGVPRAEIARRYNVPRQVITKALGPRETKPGSADEHHIYCRKESFHEVSEMARSMFGLTNHGGPKAGRGSIGKLVDAIADGEIELVSSRMGGE